MTHEEHLRRLRITQFKVILLTVISVLLHVALFYFFRMVYYEKAFTIVKIADVAINAASAMGIMSSLNTIVLLILTVTDHWRGGNIAVAIASVGIISNSMCLIGTGNANFTLPLINTTMVMTMLLITRTALRSNETISLTDELTGLQTRRSLTNQLVLRGNSKRDFSVIYLDLDNFKYINDTHGHPAGDRVLQEVSQRWRDILPKECELYRIGGDEFLIVYPHDGKPAALQQVETLTQECIDAISARHFDHERSNVDKYITVSAGIVHYPKDTDRTDLLISYADVAMYRAKKAGKNKYYVFDEDTARRIKREMEMEAIIREGLEKELFYLVYQPQFTAEGKRLRGFESLLRLKTESGEEISPQEFIPIAERTDLIIEIDRMVIRRAMREFHDAVTAPGSNLVISINVSSKHITEPDFVDEMRAALAEYDFPADRLELEITEYNMIEEMEKVVAVLKELKKMDIEIAMDDFGSGYASLSWLAKMPIDLLKLDKSLVDDIANDPKHTEFVNLIIAMGHLLGANVVAEGVEHERQKDILKDKNCNYIQGFLWSKPLEYEEALACVKADRALDKDNAAG